MGIAQAANLTQGLLGIGYSANEASNSDDQSTLEDDSFVYANIIDAIVSQKLIDINAYSLYLNDLDASTGSIIFGGLDSDKYQGDLVQMPVVPDSLPNGTDIYLSFGVALTSFALGGKDLTPSGSPPAAILDTGTSLTLLPETIANDIIQELGAYDDSEGESGTGLVLADCNLANSDKTFDFGFGGTDGSDSIKVKVPYNEMIIDPAKLGFELNGYAPQGITFQDICVLGILPASEPYILGDTFLRSAYVVYDLKNNVIALAQTNFNSTTSSIVDFKADQTAIPAVSGVASNAGISETATGKLPLKTNTASATGSGSGGVSGHATNTGSETATATSTPTSSSTKNAGVASVPALDLTALSVLGGSAMLVVFGGGWLLA